MDKEAKKTYVKYSPKVFKEKEPNIYLYQLSEEVSENEDIYTFVLDYENEGNIDQIILAKMRNSNNLKENSEKIIEYMKNQIMNNAKESAEFYNFEKINMDVESQKLPFEFTLEGKEVLLQNNPQEKAITKTYSIHESGTGKRDVLKKQLNLDNMYKLENSKKDVEDTMKWYHRRKIILEKLSPEEKELFLKGENIKNIIEENNIDVVLDDRKRMITEYLIQNYPLAYFINNKENNWSETYIEGKQNKIPYEQRVERQRERRSEKNRSLSEEYVLKKEKSLTIDAKIVLERIENKIFERYAQTGEINQRTMDTIQNYERFFELIKTGRDVNARYLALQYKKIDFEVLKTCINKLSSDQELKTYLDKKIDYVKSVDLKMEVGTEDYRTNGSVHDLYQFLANSSERPYAKDEEQITLLDTYEVLKEAIIEQNREAIEKYNEYAEKSGFEIAVPEQRTKYVTTIPQSVKDMYEIEDKDIEK